MKLIKPLENTNYILAYFLPITLITGSFLSDLSISLIGLIVLIISIIKKDLKYYFSLPLVFFWMWCVYLIFNSLISSNIYLSLESSLFYFRYGLFVVGIWYILDNNINFKLNFLYILLFVYVILLFDGYLEFFYGSNLLNHQYDNHRIQSFFGNNLLLGSYLARLLPILFSLFFSEFLKTKKSITFFMVILVLTDLLVFLSGERTSFFIVGMVSVAIILLTSQYRLIRLFTFLFSIFLIFLITMGKDNVRERMINDTIQQTQIFEEKKVIFSDRHQSFYQTSINIFSDNPLFGIGPKLYRIYCQKDEYSSGNSCSTHPHNTYIQLIAETGVFGILPIIFLFFYVLYIFSKQLYFSYIKNSKFFDDNLVCLYIALFVSIWPFMPSQNFFGNWISIVYFLPIGFILHEHSKINNENYGNS